MSSLDDWLGSAIPDVIMDDAAQWMTLLDSQRCHTADRLAFARWLDVDVRHRLAFEELSEIWARLRTLTDVEVPPGNPVVVPFPAAAGGIESGHTKSGHAEPGPRVHRAEWSLLAAAASLALGVALNGWLAPAVAEFETGAGEISTVTLADGSVLELNARTLARVSMRERQRSVDLLTGEAIFHVEPDGRAFVVRTAAGSISTERSVFAVELDSASMDISVMTGDVTVTPPVDAPMLTEYDRANRLVASDPIPLLAGEALTLAPGDRQHHAADTQHLDAALSWRNGVVIFDQLPLRQVVEEMRRYGDIPIHVADETVAQIRLSGEFPVDNPASFLPRLASHEGIEIDRGSDAWILLRAAR